MKVVLLAIYQSRQVTSYLTILGVNCAFGLNKTQRSSSTKVLHWKQCSVMQFRKLNRDNQRQMLPVSLRCTVPYNT